MSDTRSWRAAVSGWFLVLLCAPPIWAWQVRVARSRDVHPIVLDRAGAVVAALDVPPHPLHAGGTALALVRLDRASSPPNHFALDFAVVKLSADRGEERWRFLLDGSAEDFDDASAVAVDAAGDVVAVGTLTEGLPTQLLNPQVDTVIKISGADGHLLWRRDIDNAVPYPRSVVLDRAGDVFIPLGTFDGAGARFAVMK